MPLPAKQTPTVTVNGPTRAKPTSIASRIRNIGFDDEGISITIYGQSRTGKTTMWATFPGPILVMLCSGGIDSPGELRSIDTPEYRKKVKQIVVNSTEEFEEVVDYVRAEDNFRTVVLDHASGFQDIIVKEVQKLHEIPVSKPVLLNGNASKALWGSVAERSKYMLRKLLNLKGQNRVVVAQERTFSGTDGENNTASDVIHPTIGPAVTPGVASWLVPTCDYTVQSFIRPKTTIKESRGEDGKVMRIVQRGKGVEFCIRTEVHDIYMTKFRVPGGVKTDVIVDPTYEKIMKVIKGG